MAYNVGASGITFAGAIPVKSLIVDKYLVNYGTPNFVVDKKLYGATADGGVSLVGGGTPVDLVITSGGSGQIFPTGRQ